MPDRRYDYLKIERTLGEELTVKPLLDVATLKLPETIQLCPHCLGHGQYEQWYCDAPRMSGPCGICKGAQFIYKDRCVPVPKSVRAQIEVANNLMRETSATTYCALIEFGPRLFHPGDLEG